MGKRRDRNESQETGGADGASSWGPPGRPQQQQQPPWAHVGPGRSDQATYPQLHAGPRSDNPPLSHFAPLFRQLGQQQDQDEARFAPLFRQLEQQPQQQPPPPPQDAELLALYVGRQQVRAARAARAEASLAQARRRQVAAAALARELLALETLRKPEVDAWLRVHDAEYDHVIARARPPLLKAALLARCRRVLAQRLEEDDEASMTSDGHEKEKDDDDDDADAMDGGDDVGGGDGEAKRAELDRHIALAKQRAIAEARTQPQNCRANLQAVVWLWEAKMALEARMAMKRAQQKNNGGGGGEDTMDVDGGRKAAFASSSPASGGGGGGSSSGSGSGFDWDGSLGGSDGSGGGGDVDEAVDEFEAEQVGSILESVGRYCRYQQQKRARRE